MHLYSKGVQLSAAWKPKQAQYREQQTGLTQVWGDEIHRFSRCFFYGPHNIFFLNATKWYLQGLASLQGFEKIQGLSSSLNDRKNEHNNNQNNPKALHGRNNIE